MTGRLSTPSLQYWQWSSVLVADSLSVLYPLSWERIKKKNFLPPKVLHDGGNTFSTAITLNNTGWDALEITQKALGWWLRGFWSEYCCGDINCWLIFVSTGGFLSRRKRISFKSLSDINLSIIFIWSSIFHLWLEDSIESIAFNFQKFCLALSIISSASILDQENIHVQALEEQLW